MLSAFAPSRLFSQEPCLLQEPTSSLWAPPGRAPRTVPVPWHYNSGVFPVSQQGIIPQVFLTPAQVSSL